MPRFDAVISDIDGCLAPEASEPMDAAALAELAAMNIATQGDAGRGDGGGPVMTLCSGRPQPFAEAMCRLIANRSIPCIAENGVWLYHPGVNIYERDPAITPDDLLAVQKARAWVEAELGPRGVVMQPGKDASVSLYHTDTAFLHSLVPRVARVFEERAWPFRISTTWFYINCDLLHVSKATGIDRLVAAAGLSRARLAGIGDTLGDMAIRERVAFFACPANADQRLKERADFVSDHPEVRGVLDIMRRLAVL